MAHNARCSNASSPPRACTCSCGGALHGGRGQSLDPGPWDRLVDYEHNGHGTRLGRSLDGSTVGFFDRLFNSDDGALVDAVSDRFADDVADLLDKPKGERSRTEFRRELRRDHTICSLMVVVVEAMTRLRDAAPEAAREMAERVVEAIVVRRPGGVVGQLGAKTAGKLAKMATGKLQAITSLGSLPLYIETCRYVAIVSCPDPADHDEVRKTCVEPLLKATVSDELRHLWREVQERWHETTYRESTHRGGQPSDASAEPAPTAEPLSLRARSPRTQKRRRVWDLTGVKRALRFGRKSRGS
jgi:hypothetical protein